MAQFITAGYETDVSLDETAGIQSDLNAASGITDDDIAVSSFFSQFSETPIHYAVSGYGDTGSKQAIFKLTGSGDLSAPQLSADMDGTAFPDDPEGVFDPVADGYTASGLETTDGDAVYLFDAGGNYLVGRTTDGTLVLAIYLETEQDVSGDWYGYLWTALYEPLENPTPGSSDADHDELTNVLTDNIYVTTTEELNFESDGVPSGQNLFIMFAGNEDPTKGIVVTGKMPLNESEGGNITSGDTVNTSQVTGTTFGEGNQMIDEGEGLWFTFVTGSDSDFTVPNLTQTEADAEANIRFSGVFTADTVDFDVVQLQSGKTAVVKITPILSANLTPNASDGSQYVDDLLDDLADVNDEGDQIVEVVEVTLTIQTGTKKNPETTEVTWVKGEADPAETYGREVTFNTDGTATISGVKAGDSIEYVTDGDHNRVLIENAGDGSGQDSADFDIGGFTVIDNSTPSLDITNYPRFGDDGPSLDIGDMIGTGTVDPQIGEWSPLWGQDGSDDTLGLVLDTVTVNDVVVSLGPQDLGTANANPDGSFSYIGVTVDTDGAAGDESITFDLTFYSDGTYAIDLYGGFGSSLTFSTDEGGLPAGGPDPVQTLTFDPVGPENDVIFYAVDYGLLASNAELVASLGLLEAALEDNDDDDTTAAYNWINENYLMNVSTSGIGVNNNLLQGDDNPARNAGDQSFVVNPDIPVTDVRIWIDNSQPYDYDGSDGDILYYRIIYEDGTVGGWVEVTEVFKEPGAKKSDPSYFDISYDGGSLIDGVQLVMAQGAIKIPTIEFTQEIIEIANDIELDFTATITDGDGDTASDSFFVDLNADPDPAVEPDFVYDGTGANEAFNIDLATADDEWVINDFGEGDGIYLLNPEVEYALDTSPVGGAEITVNGAVIEVNYDPGGPYSDASEITAAEINIAYGDLVIDGTAFFGVDEAGTTNGGAQSDSFVYDGSGDLFNGGDGADAFVFFDPVAGGDELGDFDSSEGDKIFISASGFDGMLTPGVLAAAHFVWDSDGTAVLDGDDYFIYDTSDGSGDGTLYFDADGSGTDESPIAIATLIGEPTLDADDIVIIA